MKIYRLEIKYMEEKIITEESVYWTEQLGYFTDFSLIKNIITDKIENIDDIRILSIYCNVITPNKLWDTGNDETIYFNENGDIIFTHVLDELPKIIDTTYKLGDIVAVPSGDSSDRKFSIGIVADLPNIEGYYYIILYNNELIDGENCDSNGQVYMDHTHEISQEMHKAQPSKEISIYLRKKLKGILSISEYQKIFREEKLENLLKK